MVYEESAIPGLKLEESETLERILAQLLDGENIHMKTRYDNPYGISQLEFLADYLEAKLTETKEVWVSKEEIINGSKVIKRHKETINTYNPISTKLLRSIVEHFSMNQVSRGGLSRTEIVSCIGASLEREKSVTEKLSKSP